MGENGMSLPAVPVTQLAKFHTKAKKEGIANDPHEEAVKTFKLTAQRKASDQQPVALQQEPFKPLSTLQQKKTDGFAVNPYRPESVGK